MTGRVPGNLPSNTEINPKEHAKAITTRSEVQLPEIYVKRLVASKESAPTSDDEIMEQTEQIIGDVVKKNSNTSRGTAAIPINPHEPPIPFPQRLKSRNWISNIDILSNKQKIEENETVMLTEECSARIQRKLPPKLKDSGSFTKLSLGEAKATTVTLQVADRSFTHSRGIIEDVLKGHLILRLGEEQISFNVFKAMEFPTESDSCFQIDVIDRIIQDTFRLHHPSDAYKACIAHSQSTHTDSSEIKTCAWFLETNPPYMRRSYFEELGTRTTKSVPSIQ
ncbi:uncharacterized protein LOC111403337 [Olea europaea var. sylvestris]|uniref:uncharacterized protein LOC111403337 n=1 Tax=Olea europaea var. sylvestris TaxID=158386 RepID=UPI000C1CF52A|nr:uncharacterized protein LOC111403337 [Olea europaea var. sylvestris]